MAVSVVVPAHNAARTIGEQLEALASQETARSWELIVVDNGSTDGTGDMVEQWRDRLPRVRVVRADERAGAGHARNVGAQHAVGEVLLFCDADDVVRPGWLDALASGLETSDAVAGALDEDVLGTEASRAIRPSIFAGGLHEGLAGFHDAGSSANFGVRAVVFRDLGGFDEDFLKSQDTELCLRLQVAGYRLSAVPSARIDYRHRSSVRDNLEQVMKFATYRPLLYRRFRHAGAPRRLGFRSVGGLALTSWWLLAGRQRRLRWIGRAVRVWGRVVGSVRHRTWYV